jgi:hypothetical protein
LPKFKASSGSLSASSTSSTTRAAKSLAEFLAQPRPSLALVFIFCGVQSARMGAVVKILSGISVTAVTAKFSGLVVRFIIR